MEIGFLGPDLKDACFRHSANGPAICAIWLASRPRLGSSIGLQEEIAVLEVASPIAFYSPQNCVGFLFLDLHPPGVSASSSSSSSASSSSTLSHTQLCHTKLCHMHIVTYNFVTHNLVTHTQIVTHTQLCHTQLYHIQIVTHTHNFVTHHLCHTPSFTYLFVTHLLSHIFVTHRLSHTALSHETLSHTVFHTQLCYTPSFTHTHNFVIGNIVTHHLTHTHNFVTHHLSHTHNFVTHTHFTMSHPTLSYTTLSRTHTHTTLHIQLFDRSSTTSFVYPSFPVPLELFVLLIGRSWLVGLSGPLILSMRDPELT